MSNTHIRQMSPHRHCILVLVSLVINFVGGQLLHSTSEHLNINNVNVACDKDNILVTINLTSPFEGLIYPKGLAKNSSCMAEYADAGDHVTYKMPLWACNTMSTDVEDGIEYFNTIVVQPHRRLVTNNGRGFHIRCKYQTKEKLILNNVNVGDLGATPVDGNVPVPAHMMKIYVGQSNSNYIAENVNIGDNLTMHIGLEQQEIYGMKVTDCTVRDGLNWNEQQLLNAEGCPIDDDLMGPFSYSPEKNEAKVEFKAHKFPYTPSVYYKCNIKLCMKRNGGCEDVPPLCNFDGRNMRVKRQVDSDNISNKGNYTSDATVRPGLTLPLHASLLVAEPEDLNPSERTPLAQEGRHDGFCMSTRDFAIGIAVAGLILMLAVLLLVALLIRRRRRRKDVQASTTAGSSIYSGPYSNGGYSN